MNAGSGRDLNWFWKRWFFDGGFADLAITSVKKAGSSTAVVITAKGNKPVPVDLNISYADGTSGKVHRTVAVWEKGATAITVIIPSAKQIRRLVLGSTWVPDADKADNVYIAK
jgi:aminopeptidase N